MSPNNGCVIWITGLSGAGKTTLAQALLPLLPQPLLWFDGDLLRWVLEPMREGQSPDRTFSGQERLRGSMTISRLIKLIGEQGLTVVYSTISLSHQVQDWNRANLPGYFEVFLDMPKEVLLARDYKGIYQKKTPRWSAFR